MSLFTPKKNSTSLPTAFARRLHCRRRRRHSPARSVPARAPSSAPSFARCTGPTRAAVPASRSATGMTAIRRSNISTSSGSKIPREIAELGLEEAFDGEAIALVEWWRNAPDVIPSRRYEIEINGAGRRATHVISSTAAVNVLALDGALGSFSAAVACDGVVAAARTKPEARRWSAGSRLVDSVLEAAEARPAAARPARRRHRAGADSPDCGSRSRTQSPSRPSGTTAGSDFVVRSARVRRAIRARLDGRGGATGRHLGSLPLQIRRRVVHRAAIAEVLDALRLRRSAASLGMKPSTEACYDVVGAREGRAPRARRTRHHRALLRPCRNPRRGCRRALRLRRAPAEERARSARRLRRTPAAKPPKF